MTFDEWIRQPHVSHGGEVSSFYRLIWDAAQAEEREACAKVAEKIASQWQPRQEAHSDGYAIAAAIRGRTT